MLRSLWVATTESLQRLRLLGHQRLQQPYPPLELAWAGVAPPSSLLDRNNNDNNFDWSLWFAVPKKRRSHHKVRLRTTLQYRLKLRKDIVTDPRTGELTLKHRLPFNWFDYLPPPPKVELSVYKQLRRKRYLDAEDQVEQNPQDKIVTAKGKRKK